MKIAKNCFFIDLRSIAVLGCLVCLKAIDGNFSVKIVSPSAGQIIQHRNQTVEFNCTVNSGVSGSAFQTFEWLRNSKGFNRENVKNTPYWSSFEIQGLRTSEDEGKYTCIYGNASDERTVFVASKPEIVVGQEKTTQSPYDATVDDSPVLRCFAKGWPYPNLVWIKDEQDLNVSNKDNKYLIRKQDMNTITLKIIGIAKEDQGQYICKAENIIGAVNHSIYVMVDDILVPKIKAAHNVYSAETGTNATLICDGEDIERSSSTAISWKFNGAEINSTSNHYDIADNYTDQGDTEASPKVRTELTIYNFGHPDVGTYTCSVATELSTASDTIVVTVKAKDNFKTGGLGRAVVIGAVVLSCVVVILLAVAGFLVWRRNKKRRWMRAIAQKYYLQDQQFDKDVFVSYSSKDYDWVEQNLQPLFERHGIQYLIHSRDFTPGKAFVENMADSVYHSRKIILVVSLNYLNSGYCKEEMHMAVHRCVEKQDSSLILIRIDNIKTKEIPKDLRDRTFIDFTSKEETHTWEERVVEYVRSQVPPFVSEVSQETNNKVNLLRSFCRVKRKADRNKPNLKEFDDKVNV